MATIAIRPPEIMRFHGDFGRIQHFPATTPGSTTWSKGDFLKRNGAAAEPCVAGDATFLGLALSACPLVTRTDVLTYPVWVFMDGDELIMNVWNDDTASANDEYVAATHKGNYYDLAISGAPNAVAFVVNIGATADQVLQILDIAGEIGGGVASADYYPRVIVRIKQAALFAGV